MNSIYSYDGGGGDPAPSKAAVLVHGAGMDHTVWRPLARNLSHRGFRILAVDLPGHGQSPGPPWPSVEQYADWLLAFTRAAGAERFSLVGHSLGGLIALQAAAAAPDRVGRLVLLAAAASMPVHSDLLAAAEERSQLAVELILSWSFGMRGRIGGRSDPGTSAIVVARRMLQRGLSVLGCDLRTCHGYRNGEEAAARVAVPTLVVAGREDRMVSVQRAEDLARRISLAEFLVLEGAGHMMTADDPARVQDAVVGFLASG